jgi:hypothetical protein
VTPTTAKTTLKAATTVKATTTVKGATTVKPATTLKATTKVPATTVKPATTLVPKTTLAGGTSPSTGCATTQRPIFLWTEWTFDYPEVYYPKLLKFIAGNCAGLKVTRVILRILDPIFPGDSKLWGVSTSSALYTQFISKLPAGIDLKVYPYLKDPTNLANWATYGGSSNCLQSLFKYAQAWNTLLASVGNPNRFSGIVVDGEEQAGFLTYMPTLPGLRSSTGLKFGYAIAYYRIGAMSDDSGMGLYVDEFYLEMYDFYYPNMGSTVKNLDYTSPGVLNNPSAFMSSLVSGIIGGFISQYGPKSHFMWSNQQDSTACIMPLGENCGVHDDFGTWSPRAMNDFLGLIAQTYPVFAKQPAGFFQFNLTPLTWL